MKLGSLSPSLSKLSQYLTALLPAFPFFIWPVVVGHTRRREDGLYPGAVLKISPFSVMMILLNLTEKKLSLKQTSGEEKFQKNCHRWHSGVLSLPDNKEEH